MNAFASPIRILIIAILLSGCDFFTALPNPTTTQERIAMFKEVPAPAFEKPVTIYWSKEQIPFIEAQTDADAARALGFTHAHLRLGQMETAKRIINGRVSEMVGPLATHIDETIRMIGFHRATQQAVANMPEESRLWLESYAEGVNHYKANMKVKPHDMIILNMNDEPWTMEDSISIGRIGGADIHWLAMLFLLPERTKENWPHIWQQFAHHQKTSIPSFSADEMGESSDSLLTSVERDLFKAVLRPLMRVGSNSMVISGERSKSGAPILANDPHLGFSLPNIWLLSGIKSPSYHAVGLMPVGTPIVALGRNPYVSWGGTNMRNYGSDFVDVTGETFTTESHEVKRRAWWDTTVTTRNSDIGPIISDSDLFAFPKGKDIALRWVGHLPSDEITAYLKIMRAKSWKDVKKAANLYGLPGQNMLFADVNGNIGQISAAMLPKRGQEFPKDLWTDRKTSDASWKTILTANELPYIVNPQKGVVASANNRPSDDAPTRIGWFFAKDDRISRIYARLGEREKWDIPSLQSIQRDSYSPINDMLNQFIIKIIEHKTLSPEALETVATLRQWNGFFDPESKQAYVYHAFITEFAPAFYASIGRKGEELLWWRSTFLPEQLLIDIKEQPEEDITKLLAAALKKSVKYVKSDTLWGDIHRIKASHPVGMIPVLGRHYRAYDLPVAGSVETVFKSSHEFTAERHSTTFGSQSKHFSDMAGINENYFVLFGGQDGWLRSENFADQVPLWSEGKRIQFPMETSLIEQKFPYRIDFNGADTKTAIAP